MDDNATIAILIPFYTNLNFLKSAIESVVAQDSANWDCIVIDDCGPESSFRLVSEFHDHGVQYIRNETNLGIAANWNRAIDLAKSDYLMLLHADDVLSPTFVSETLATFRQFPSADVVHCGATIINEAGDQTKNFVNFVKTMLKPTSSMGFTVVQGDRGLASITRGNWIICPTAVFKRSVFAQAKFDESLSFAMDLWFFSQLLLTGSQIVGIDSKNYNYRIHGGSQTSALTSSGLRFAEEWSVINRVQVCSKELGWLRTYLEATLRITLRAHLIFEAIRSILRLQFKRSAVLSKWALVGPDQVA